METHTSGHGPEATGDRIDAEDAEDALVEHYARLVKIAYVTLPAIAGRHRRVLLAHRVVQRALPPRHGRSSRGGQPGETAYALLREAAVRGALALGRPAGGWRRPARRAWTAAPLPPAVTGLRVSPLAGRGEVVLDRVLGGLDAPARAACALAGVERLPEREITRVLARCGVAAPQDAVRDARRSVGAAALLAACDVDPCLLRVRPTGVLRRRRHLRAGAATAGALALAVALLGVAVGGTPAAGGPAGAPGGYAAALDPAHVVSAGATSWLDAGRLDFAAWPARGGRIHDRALIGRALAAWGRHPAHLRVATSQGTADTPPDAPPRLLFSGDVDGAAIVLFSDGSRLARYAEPLDGGGGPALDLARAGGAEGTSAAAVVLDRSDGNVRYLTAPWVTGVALRDLLKPDGAAEPVRRAADGVTDPVPSATRDPGCGAASGRTPASGWPAVEVATASEVPGGSFLLTDLGDLTPVHLTYASGPGARQREATGADGLATWAHTACRLALLRGHGVRTAGTWRFATQSLPDGAGTARWLCTRADQWSGDDHVLAQFLPPGSAADAPATLTAMTARTPACGPLRPAVLTGALWKSPAGRWYLLAAGSARVAGIEVTGGLRYATAADVLSVPATPTTKAELTGRLAAGGDLPALK